MLAKGELKRRPKIRVIAPTFLEIDIALSFRIIIKFFKSGEILLRASKARPHVKVASPIIGIINSFRLVKSRFFAIPNAKERAVPAWPA